MIIWKAGFNFQRLIKPDPGETFTMEGALRVGDVEYTQIGLYAGAPLSGMSRRRSPWHLAPMGVMRLRSCGEMHRRRRPAATRHLEMAGCGRYKYAEYSGKRNGRARDSASSLRQERLRQEILPPWR